MTADLCIRIRTHASRRNEGATQKQPGVLLRTPAEYVWLHWLQEGFNEAVERRSAY